MGLLFVDGKFVFDGGARFCPMAFPSKIVYNTDRIFLAENQVVESPPMFSCDCERDFQRQTFFANQITVLKR